MATESRSALASQLVRGYTLPAGWYTGAATLALERERIFAHAWQYVAAAQELAAPGDYVSARVGHVPIVLARGDDGELRGFVNVCRHRGHIVATGSGNRRTLQCPYHAWTYGLDGCLRNAPRAERETGFAKEELGLLPVRVETWGPFVFANPDAAAPPLAEALGGVPELVAASGLEVGGLVLADGREWTLEANWKVGIENYLECYHCPVAHPGFSTVIDADEDAYAYSVSPDGRVLSQTAPVRASALAGGSGELPYDPSGEVTQAQYHFLWPATTLNIDPGRPNLSLDVWIPDGPEHTSGFTHYYFAPDVPEALRRDLVAFSTQVGAEDDALVRSVQRGLRSGMVPQGRLLLGSERLIHRFQQLVLEALEPGGA